MPNPGSWEAQLGGCTCPVLDNHRGEGMPGGRFWISADCQMHARRGASKPSREGGKKLEEGNQAVGGGGDDASGADVAQVALCDFRWGFHEHYCSLDAGHRGMHDCPCGEQAWEHDSCTCKGEFTCEAHRA